MQYALPNRHIAGLGGYDYHGNGGGGGMPVTAAAIAAAGGVVVVILPLGSVCHIVGNGISHSGSPAGESISAAGRCAIESGVGSPLLTRCT